MTTPLMPLVAFLQARPDQWFTRAQLVEAGLKGHHRNLDVTLRNTTHRGIVLARVRPDGLREYQFGRLPLTRAQTLALAHAARKPAMSAAQVKAKADAHRARAKARRAQAYADQAATLPAPLPGPWGAELGTLLAQPDVALPLPVLALATGRDLHGLQRSVVAYRAQGLLITTGQDPLLVRINPSSGLLAWAAGTGPAVPLNQQQVRAAARAQRKAARITARQEAKETKRMQILERRRVRVQQRAEVRAQTQQASRAARAEQKRAERAARDEQKRQEKQQAAEARRAARREQLRARREADEQAQAQRAQAQAEKRARRAQVMREKRAQTRDARQRATQAEREVRAALRAQERDERTAAAREARATAARERTVRMMREDATALLTHLQAAPDGLTEAQLTAATGLPKGRIVRAACTLRDQGDIRITRHHVADLYQITSLDLPDAPAELTPNAERIAAHLATRPADTIPYMAQTLGMTRHDVGCALSALRGLGRLEWKFVGHMPVLSLARQEVRNAAD